MKVLLDECVPRALKRTIESSGHGCSTVQETGWAGKPNGELLDLAEPQFEVLITADTHLRYQQNLTGRQIALIVLVARSNRLADLSPLFRPCIAAIEKIKPGDVVDISKAEQM